MSEAYDITVHYVGGRHPDTLRGPGKLVDLLRQRAADGVRVSTVTDPGGRSVTIDFARVDRITAELV